MGGIDIDWNAYSSISYLVFGSMAVIANLILLLSCTIQKSLWVQRKFYILVVTLAFMDFTEAFGYINVGITQVITTYGPPPPANSTPACVDLPKWSNLFSRTGGVASSIIHLIVAAERLLATAFPMMYFQRWKLRHVICLMCVGGVDIVGFLAFTAYLFSFKPRETVQEVCDFLGTLPDLAFNLFWYQKCSLGILAVGVCLAIVVINHTKKSITNDAASKRQAMITRTIMIITGIQFGLICIPSIIYLMVTAKLFACKMCEKSVIVLGLTNSTVGFAVYMWTNPDMRKAVKAFLMCHRLNTVGASTMGMKSMNTVQIQVKPTGGGL